MVVIVVEVMVLTGVRLVLLRLRLILISTLGVEDQTCFTVVRVRVDLKGGFKACCCKKLSGMGPKPEEFPFRDDTIVVFVEEVENCCRDFGQR